jgi:Leucine-rich repeat (LRR) protein
MYYTEVMLKIFILIAIIVGGSVIAYVQGTYNSPSVESNVLETNETTGPESGPSVSGEDTNTSSPNPAAPSGKLLDLSGKGLTQTPQSVFNETDVQTLDLSNNQLTGSLPAEVRLLQSLRVLNISNNQFTGVPAEVGQLSNLEVLDLSNNRLTGLPLELGNLSNLKILNLKGNEYSEFDLGLIKEKLPNTVIIEID